MTIHYLDNSATTPLCDAAKAAIEKTANDIFGNPSSLHTIGVDAESAVEAARADILRAMGFHNSDGTLIFTSGGTEAANIAIIGCATAKARNKGKTVIVGETEHDCVLKSADHLSTLGYKVVKIPSPDGVWDMEKYLAALDENVILVSAMLVNNETGAVNDINEIARAAREASPSVLVHTDAVQGFLKLDGRLSDLDVDMISISGHKIGAPKGVGALYIKNNVIKSRSIAPIIFGGGQEKGLRSGTENTIGICAFGAAAKYGKENLSKNLLHIASLRERLISGLCDVDGIRLNVPKTQLCAQNILNMTVFGIRSETMLHHLSSYGVFVSSGSACASNTGHSSQALLSFGLPEKEAGESIRVSLGVQNTEDDIDAFISALKDGISKLVRRR